MCLSTRPTSKWHFLPGLSRLWGPITLCVDLRLKWGLKKSYSRHREFFNSMSQAPYMQGNRVNFWLLVVGSQTSNLTPDPCFGHNLCFRCPNESCEPIVDIYVQRTFQWYKELFNPMDFDPCNCSLKVQESIKTPTPKVGAHLGAWGFIFSHSPALPRV
jgi:hypothetical protein